MMKAKDMTGEKFGRLSVVSRADKKGKSGNAEWLCLCDCGKEVIVRGTRLRNGYTKSCGCYARELSSLRLSELTKEERRERAVSHGQRGTNLYEVWHGMKQRCLNPNAPGYDNYGARGIRVCDAWMSFEPFYDWAQSSGYSSGLSIDRIDVNGDYEPANCRWITMNEQQRNKRNNVLICCRGETHCLAEWSRISGISYDRISHRLKAGWGAEEAIFKPVRPKKKSTK